MTETTDVLPIEASIGGKNAYVHWCDVHDQRRHYGVCLHLLAGYREGRLKVSEDNIYNDCVGAMVRGTCAAVAMREQEVAAGRALFHVERAGSIDRPSVPAKEIRIDRTSGSYLRGWALAAGEKIAKVVKSAFQPKAPSRPAVKPKSDELVILGMDMGQMINDMVAEAKSAPTPKVETKPAPTASSVAPKQGESMLELARRLRAERQAQQGG